MKILKGKTDTEADIKENTPTLTLIGQASMKIKTREGVIIYIDPYYPGDYKEKADIILVSHEHRDHNKVELCTKKADCKVLRVKDTINPDNSYPTFQYYGVTIEPVAAYNKNHPRSSTNGFLLTFDGITVYHSSDTSKIPEMAKLKDSKINYAFYPIDGYYNMGAAEAAECANFIGAEHNIPFHFLQADPKTFRPDHVLIMAYGDTIELNTR